MGCHVRSGMPVYKVCTEGALPQTCILHRNMLFPLVSNVESEFSSEISGDHVEGQEVDQESTSEDVEYVGPITRSWAKRQKGCPNMVQAASLVYEAVMPAVVNQLLVHLAESGRCLVSHKEVFHWLIQFKATVLPSTRMRVVDSLVLNRLLRIFHSFLDLQGGERLEALTTWSRLFI